MLKQFIIVILVTLLVANGIASQNKVQVGTQFGIESFVTSGDQAPLWLVSRQQGRWNLVDKNQIISYASIKATHSAGKYWKFSTEAELDYSEGNKLFYLHTGNVRASWKYFSLTVGRHLFSPIFDGNYCGNGSFLFGNNSRPLSRITIGIPVYTSLPFTNNRLEVRSEISHGRLDDGDGFYNHNKVLLHEKYAYVRWNGGKWLPYMGLNHSVLMGGYDSNGSKVPIDYWPSFFAKSSQKIGGGDATNAAGAHMGLYDFGFYRKLTKGELRVYYQIPFSDRSGMLFWNRNLDQIVGFNLIYEGKKWLENMTVEWISTSHQSGNGTPDAIRYVEQEDGSLKWEWYTGAAIRNLDLDQFMAEMGETRATPYSYEEVTRYLEDHFNNGNPFGGRDGYLNNGTYTAGWTNYGMIMGSPLNLIREQVALNNPKLGVYTLNNIVNDRVKALHVGGKGSITDCLSWNGMLTYSVNYGSYFNQYPGRYTWDETENYYFKGGLKQVYSMVGVSWHPQKIEKLEVSGNFSFDSGEIFNSIGLKVGTRWVF